MSERCFNSTMSEVVQRSVAHSITPLRTGEGLAKRRLVAGAAAMEAAALSWVGRGGLIVGRICTGCRVVCSSSAASSARC
jgi:hypothetical protein